MKLLPVCFLVLTIVIASCNDEKVSMSSENSDTIDQDSTEKIVIKPSAAPTDSIIRQLQGEWKEVKYPFRVAQFKDSAVKFIEEGIIEEPKFLGFEISKACPYEVNNLKNANPDDHFLVIADSRTCEIIKLLNDTLTLSGYSVNTQSDYHIIFSRVK